MESASNSFEFTTELLIETLPVARKNTGFQMPALRSGTKETPAHGFFSFGPLYPKYFQLSQSNQLSANSTPVTSWISCSGVTLTASTFREPRLIHRVTLSS